MYNLSNNWINFFSFYRTTIANTLPNQPKIGWRWWHSGPYHENPCLITRFEPHRECLDFREAVSFQGSQAKKKGRASGWHHCFFGHLWQLNSLADISTIFIEWFPTLFSTRVTLPDFDMCANEFHHWNFGFGLFDVYF